MDSSFTFLPPQESDIPELDTMAKHLLLHLQASKNSVAATSATVLVLLIDAAILLSRHVRIAEVQIVDGWA
jgi:hypothetical protein